MVNINWQWKHVKKLSNPILKNTICDSRFKHNASVVTALLSKVVMGGQEFAENFHCRCGSASFSRMSISGAGVDGTSGGPTRGTSLRINSRESNRFALRNAGPSKFSPCSCALFEVIPHWKCCLDTESVVYERWRKQSGNAEGSRNQWVIKFHGRLRCWFISL